MLSTAYKSLLEEELKDAILNHSEKAIEKTVLLLIENSEKMDNLEQAVNDTRSDVKVLAEVMKEGFRQIDKRFEQVDKRFEEQNQRIIELREDMNARFEAVDKRFEQVDKRFEQVDKRFDQIDKRFTMMMWFIGILMTIAVAAIKLI